MPTSVVDEARLHPLNSADAGSGRYVLYWMQATVRTRQNHALEHAVRTANTHDVPLVVCFGIDPKFRDSTPRSRVFLVDGLLDVAEGLARRDITFVVRRGHPRDVALSLCDDATALVADRNYLRGPRRWRTELARRVTVPMVEVESNVVVPVESASNKREYASRTIRPKILDRLDRFVEELTTTAVGNKRRVRLESLGGREALLEAASAPQVRDRLDGGELAAHRTLQTFIEEGLEHYPNAGVEPTGSASSHLSRFLHYGHISPADIVRSVRKADPPMEALDDFVEELVVRRELAHNYVWFEPDYASYRALPEWARRTLEEHRDDPREVVYTKRELESARTHDRPWNAAMTEMRETGYLHNRMRMYWGKKIIDWTNTPQYAFRVALDLNNRYFLDGRDPNSYANVGWLFGLHDRAFGERAVIGKIRPMTASGLARKIDVDAYVAYVEDLTGVAVVGETSS